MRTIKIIDDDGQWFSDSFRNIFEYKLPFMTTNILPGAEEILNAVKYMPCVSILMPFEPKMLLKTELEYKLKLAVGKVESELLASYTEDKAMSVLYRLRALIKDLDFNTHKKSIAIFVSQLVQKVFYLDIAVEEKIIIDDSFEIRDLVYSKKEMHKYLVLVLSSKRTRIYLGNTNTFVRIVSNVPDHIAAYKNDVSERVANFSDPSERKEVMLEKFLRHTDDGLSILLKAYPLPLFIIGADRVIGHFKKITHNANRILGYVHGNYEEATEEELRKALQPEIADWKKVKQDDLLRQLDAAAGAKKLVAGIENVWREATHKRGRLLVVEKNFIYPAHLGNGEDIIYMEDHEAGNNFYIKDAVDDVIEKIFEAGGDVEFVDAEVLKDYGRIALILYY
ncbi:MAG TPA: hypothetical protein VET23_03010 [Chitinophagaceae bacterium]|nr:hypothetical protein [Chitinophagaceae bacterium]